MGESAAALGVSAVTFEFNGRPWPVPQTDFKVEALYCSWLEQRGFQAVQRQRDRMSPDDYREALAAWQRDVAAGEYEWEGETRFRSLSRLGSAGWRHYAWLRLNRADPEASREMIDRVCDGGRARELDELLGRADGPLGRPKSGSGSPPPASAP
jgi:hypothetical protein